MSSLAKQLWEESQAAQESSRVAFKSQVTAERVRQLLQPFAQEGKYETYMSLTDAATRLLDVPSEGLSAERTIWLMEALRAHGLEVRYDERETSGRRVQIRWMMPSGGWPT